MSGYDESHVLQKLPADQQPPFLHEPFTVEQLTQTVLRVSRIAAKSPAQT